MTQDRTRAIVEAAERLAAATDLRLTRAHLGAEADGFVWTIDSDPNSPRARALFEAKFALARALAMPATQWTRTPPSEPGYYWVSTEAFVGDPDGVWILERLSSGGWSDNYDNPRTDAQMAAEGYKFWPVRIEEPPSET